MIKMMCEFHLKHL